MKHTSSPARRLLRAALLPALLLVALTASARAAVVTADCTAAASSPPLLFNSITAALNSLDNDNVHTINVIGPCTEVVNIQQRNRITIQSASATPAVINGLTASPPSPPEPIANVIVVNGSNEITLRNLILNGGVNGLLITRGSTVTALGVSMIDNAANGLRADTGSVVSLARLLLPLPPPPAPAPAPIPVVISGNQSVGISTDAAILIINGGVTVEDNEGPAMNIIAGRLIVNGGAADNVFRNNGTGINLDGTVANFSGQNTIQNNNLTGVQIISGRAVFSGFTNPSTNETRSTTIEGHTLGFNVVAAASVTFGGPNRIRNNGVGNPDAEFRGGIRIGTVGRVQMDGPNEVTGNTGPGVFLDFNGALAITGAIVTNNTGGGVRVARSSVGNFGLAGTYSGNGGAQISCDDTSLIAGPGLVGLPNKAVACKNIEHAQGPPRPSVPKEQDE